MRLFVYGIFYGIILFIMLPKVDYVLITSLFWWKNLCRKPDIRGWNVIEQRLSTESGSFGSKWFFFCAVWAALRKRTVDGRKNGSDKCE